MRIVIADDAMLLREGLARLLADAGFDVVGKAATAPELLRAVRLTDPDVAIVDIKMPPTHTDEGLVAARRSARASRRRRPRPLALPRVASTRCGCSKSIPNGSATCSRNGSPTWRCSPTR